MAKLHFRYAAMNAGKSTALLQAAHNYEERGMAHVDGLPVLCYGLRGDFRGEAFLGSAKLLTLADELEEMKTICACGKKASMNMRIDTQGGRVLQGEQVLIGGNERNRAVCPSCFYAADGVGAARAPGLFG